MTAHYAAAQVAPDDAYAQAVMADLPLAYYRLDDAGTVMYDATNNRVNGSYGSGITKRASSLVPNTSNAAATFPSGAWSAASIATVPQNALLQPAAVTVEAWIKEQTTNTTGDNIDFVSYGSQTGGRAYGLTLMSTNAVKLYIGVAGSSISAIGGTVLTPGTVYHVVGTYDGSSVAKIYVNGNLDGSTAATAPISYATIGSYGLSIGAGQSTARKVFNGSIDEVAVYGKALSSTAVAQHYNTSLWTVSQAGPPHILTWAYLTGVQNVGVSMQYLLRHVDWVETIGGDGTLASAFRAAGGRHSAWYIDPGIGYYCSSPFGPTSVNTPGSCALPSGPLGDPSLSSDDGAWLHATSAITTSGKPACGSAPAGARLHTWSPTNCSDPNDYLWGEPFNPGSSHVQTAFASATRSAASSTTLDAFFMDDSSAHYDPQGYIYQFGSSASEYDALGSGAGAAYNHDVIALACKATKPVFFNGPSWNPLDGTNGPAERADDTRYLQSPCVVGMPLEGGFTGPPRKALNNFIGTADQALLAQSLGKLAVVLNYGCSYGDSCFDPVGDRIYGLGGIWLVYDPRYTMGWNGVTRDTDPHMVDVDGNWDSMVAEYGIVPTQPYQTASNVDITTLQIPERPYQPVRRSRRRRLAARVRAVLPGWREHRPLRRRAQRRSAELHQQRRRHDAGARAHLQQLAGARRPARGRRRHGDVDGDGPHDAAAADRGDPQAVGSTDGDRHGYRWATSATAAPPGGLYGRQCPYRTLPRCARWRASSPPSRRSRAAASRSAGRCRCAAWSRSTRSCCSTSWAR